MSDTEILPKVETSIKNNNFAITLLLFVGAGASLFMLGLMFLGGLKNGFSEIFILAYYAFPICGMIHLVLYVCSWAQYRLLASIFRGEKKGKAVATGTLWLVILSEVVTLFSLLNTNSTYSLIVLYIPLLSVFGFSVSFLVLKVLGPRLERGSKF